ncbi:hypothetical protein [Roseovarius aestuariivivens]|uniref:hypothetical protein n=1 Tax=Roseovarius aestuariivivens TaxID=1888910 RepID=UPI0010805149|nr:hypothetical protein [Roseovarius aestuariivivens]
MKALFAAALVLCAGPALALSCMRPTVAGSFVRADAAEQIYVVVHGRLQFDEALIPEPDFSRQDPPDTLIPARLTGTVLSRAGFETAFDRDVTLKLQCFGPWCGGASAGTDYLVFVEKTGTEYVVPADPCGSMIFADPTPAQLDQALACLRGEACEPAF